MKHRIWTAGLLAGLLAATAITVAQEAAEQYIPIGESPGLSGDKTVKGQVIRVDYDADMLMVKGRSETRIIRTDDATRFYLDRTDQKRSNRLGDFSDCQVGREVEVLVGDDDKADWIKIDTD